LLKQELHTVHIITHLTVYIKAILDAVKITAIILFLCFSAFTAEAVILPYKANITITKPSFNGCSGKCKMMQHCKKDDSNKACHQSCSNCPVFGIFYAARLKTIPFINPIFKSSYNSFTDRFISAFITDTWKPPNTIKF
jgi:hypothetical protein